MSNNESTARKMVGNYILGKTIGEGTFGKVKIAVHIPSGEKVAVKVLEKSRIKEQADVRRVNREIKILKKTRHVNVIQLYEVLDTQNSVYLIMENADGGEMFDYIVAHRHVAEKQACAFFHQIVDGVEVLHHHEITHRDLKPENLLLKHTANGWLVKIVDFGLSNTHEGGKMLSTACGSPCYAAPEMIAGKRYVGPMADIWSMGVILFALVCGYLPFEDPNTSALFKKIMSGQYRAAKWISAEVKDLIRKILEVDPKKRVNINCIKQHPWYTSVKEEDVPKDIVHSDAEVEAARIDAMKGVIDAGLEHQAVIDCLASKACNSLTATYYLLEERAKKRMMKMKMVGSSTGEVSTALQGSVDVSNTVNTTSSSEPSHRNSQNNKKNGVHFSSSPCGRLTPQNHEILSSNLDVNDLSAIPKLNLHLVQHISALSNGNNIVNPRVSMLQHEDFISQSAREHETTQNVSDVNRIVHSQTARPTTADRESLIPVPVRKSRKEGGTFKSPIDASMGNTNPMSSQEDGTVTGPPPEFWADLPKTGESVRPGTRRSRTRSRSNDAAGDERNMFTTAGFVDCDQLSNIPITVTCGSSEVATVAAFPRRPKIQQHTKHVIDQHTLQHDQIKSMAPLEPKSSKVCGLHSTRRGRYLVNACKPGGITVGTC